jgi:hypothetical protein
VHNHNCTGAVHTQMCTKATGTDTFVHNQLRACAVHRQMCTKAPGSR